MAEECLSGQAQACCSFMVVIYGLAGASETGLTARCKLTWLAPATAFCLPIPQLEECQPQRQGPDAVGVEGKIPEHIPALRALYPRGLCVCAGHMLGPPDVYTSVSRHL